MIEVTKDLIRAAHAATCGDDSEDCIAEALEAAFAIVERDYRVSYPCTGQLTPELRCQGTPGHIGEHETRGPTGNRIKWTDG